MTDPQRQEIELRHAADTVFERREYPQLAPSVYVPAGERSDEEETATPRAKPTIPLCQTCAEQASGFKPDAYGCAWCRLQAEIAEKEAELDATRAALRDAYAFIDDLLTSNPNIIGRSTLQDYARFNRVMMAKDDLARRLEGKKA